MTWFRVDDDLCDHPKVVALQARPGWEKALALWVIAGSWSAKHLTNGAIPRAIVARLGCSLRAADVLASVGLWDVTDDGWAIHGWAERNPTRSSVEARRAETRERVAKWRGNAVTNDVRNAVTNDVRNDVRNASGNSVGTLPPSLPLPSPPIPDQKRGESACVAAPTRASEPVRVELPDAAPRQHRVASSVDQAAWQIVWTQIQSAYMAASVAPPQLLPSQRDAACAHARGVASTHGRDLLDASLAIAAVSARASTAKDRVFALLQEDPWAVAPTRGPKRDTDMDGWVAVAVAGGGR